MNLTRVKSATSEFIKVLRYGKSDVQTSDPVLPHGIDSKPVKNDLAIYAKTDNSSQSVILGYLKNSDKTLEGETRIYATDADGNEVFSILLNRSGVCEFGGNTDNAVRFSELETAYNQLKSDHDDLVSAFNQHVHATAATGPPSKPTTIPSVIPATPSTGDITGAKINEIKTP